MAQADSTNTTTLPAREEPQESLYLLTATPKLPDPGARLHNGRRCRLDPDHHGRHRKRAHRFALQTA
jgi:hypothetical protein